MAKVLDGRKAADRLLQQLEKKVSRMQKPVILATILVGDRFDSALYVRLKTKAAARVGIKTEPHRLSKNVSQQKLHTLLRKLSARKTISGILLQLPLPKHLNADYAVSRITPDKDADGFHPANRRVVPPPVAAVLHLIRSAHVGKHRKAIILAKPSVFSQRLAEELGKRGHTVLTEQPTKRIPLEVKRADIVVTAMGSGPFLHGRHVKRGATVIDVGTRRKGKKVVGDADPSVMRVARAISPVPGGVGPLTVAYLLANTVRLSQ